MQLYIYINGYPGVGKSEVANYLGLMYLHVRILDTRLIISLAGATLQQTDPGYLPLRARLHWTVLESLANAQLKPDVEGDQVTDVLIVTDEQTEDADGRAWAHRHYRVAKARGARFVSVVLECSLEETVRRAAGGDLAALPARRLEELDEMTKIWETDVVYEFENDPETELLFIPGVDVEFNVNATGRHRRDVARTIHDLIYGAMIRQHG